MTSRSPSLPQLSDRGRGLAEIKGVDPMERRVEVEKKERYAQALRAQMEANASKKRRDGSEHDMPDPPFDSRGFGGASGSGYRVPESPHSQRDSSVPAPLTMYEGSPPLPPAPHGGRHAAYSPARSEMPPPSATSGGDWGTADKVSQIQDLMRQRIRNVEEEQRSMWAKVQASLADQNAAASRVAEEALRRQLDAAAAAHAEEMRRAMEQVNAAQRECAAQAHRSEAFSGDLHSLRLAVEQLQIESGQHKSQLEVHTVDIERLKHAHEECARFRADMQRLQREMHDEVAKLRAEQREEARHSREHLERHSHEIDRLRAERAELVNQQRDLASQQQAVNATVGQVQAELQDLAGKVGGLPGQLKKLRDDIPRIAERIARAIAEGMRLPEPVQPTLPPPACPPEVSEDAYAVLSNGQGEFHELPDLRNVVGRAANCNVCINGSQQISNKHASVDFNSEGRVYIKDLGSRNGTFLNDHRVPGDAGLVLQSGDAVRLGADGPTYVFEYGPAYFARWPREPERVQDRYPTAAHKGNRGR